MSIFSHLFWFCLYMFRITVWHFPFFLSLVFSQTTSSLIRDYSNFETKTVSFRYFHPSFSSSFRRFYFQKKRNDRHFVTIISCFWYSLMFLEPSVYQNSFRANNYFPLPLGLHAIKSSLVIFTVLLSSTRLWSRSRGSQPIYQISSASCLFGYRGPNTNSQGCAGYPVWDRLRVSSELIRRRDSSNSSAQIVLALLFDTVFTHFFLFRK